MPLLRRAGFEISEVAHMLNITANHVMVADHHGRRKRSAKSSMTKINPELIDRLSRNLGLTAMHCMPVFLN